MAPSSPRSPPVTAARCPGGDAQAAWPLRGVAPDAAVWGAQVLEPDPLTGGATGPDSGVVAAIDWCVAEWQSEVADGSSRDLVINLSLGSPGGCAGDPVAAAVDAAYSAGAVVMVAAGNSGDGEDTVGVPACAAGAFPVAAAADHSLPVTPGLAGIESNGRYVAPFSSRGPAMLNGAAGPGVTIASAFNTDQPTFVAIGCPMTTTDTMGDTVPNPGCYVASSGTSFATPFLSGVAAQMLDANPDLTPGEVYQILRDTAQPWGPEGYPNIVAGAGMVDGQAAVAQAEGGSVCVDYAATPGPLREVEVSSVGKGKVKQFPLWIEDPSLPLAITMTIDGSFRRGVWGPDLDMQLMDAAGNPYEVPNPLYPLFSPDPFIPAPGTSSTCVAGEDCGLIGVQETLHLPLPVAAGEDLSLPGPHYILEVYPWDGSPNNGRGGSFTLEFSNAYTSTSSADPEICVLTADAGPDQSVSDSDDSGDELVQLDGSGSVNATTYLWTAPGVAIPDGMLTSAVFPVGTHTVTLTVTNGSASDSDTTVIQVNAPGPAGTMHVGDLDAGGGSSGGSWAAEVTIAVDRGGHSALVDQDILVSGTWSSGEAASCQTGASGSCTVAKGGIAKRTKSVSFSVTDLSDASGTYSYAAGDNHDPDGDSNGTAITVPRP